MPKVAKKKSSPKTSLPTVINFILDETGSMSSIKSSVISGFNEYVNSLKKQKSKFSFTLTKFDSEGIRIPYTNKDIKDVPELTDDTYRPDAMTPLYDAVCKTIKVVEKEIKKDQPVLVAIMTDGEENASKEFTQSDLGSIIKELEAKGNWTFVFLGANQDSWAVAQKFGIKKGNVMDWQATDKGTNQVFMAMASSTSNYSANVLRGVKSTASFFVDKNNGPK